MGRKAELGEFHQRTSFTLRLKEKTFLVAAVGPENKSQLHEGFQSLSPQSIRNRFLAGKKDFTPQELSYLTELDGENHYALGILEHANAQRGIGIVRLVRMDNRPDCAEVAITIIDEYQGKGLGAILMDLIILAAIERGIQRLSYTYLVQNTAIEKLLTRYSPLRFGPISNGSKQVWLDLTALHAPEIRNRLLQFLPEI